MIHRPNKKITVSKTNDDYHIKKGSIRDLPPKKPRGDNIFKPKEAKYVQMLGSPAHTYGNVLAYIQNFVLNNFPEDMFKTIHVNSKIAHRQLRTVNQEFIKKTKPMIIFRPRIGDYNEDRFLKGTMLTENIVNKYYTLDQGNYMPFITDRFHKFDVKYQLNRQILYVDVICIFETFMQQTNYYHYIQNVFQLGHPMMLNTHLESYIPQEMLQVISDVVKIPMYDENGYTREFLSYLNQRSMFPVTYKLAGSSGKREYFRLYPANLLTTFSELNKDEGDKVGQTMSQYQVSFSIKVEFNATGLYFVVGEDVVPRRQIEFPDDSTVIPIFTDVIYPEDVMIKEGWHLYNSASCRLEVQEDAICINEMLNESIRTCLNYHIQNGMPVLEFLDIIVRRQGKQLELGKDYDVDFDRMVIQFHNKDIFQTYKIIVAINVEYINELIKNLIHE